ncbi:MAG TPA: hypothetical protein VEN29_11055 [Casimicrobiaceae bacterium]|nr:hypothetical protein [Casimicrobiaceae bacterium]
MRPLIRALVICVALVFSITRAGATQFGTDATDLYWNPNESGWGLQVVQESDVLFVTLYVYDPGNPIWYTATGIAQTNSNTVWVGDLYRTTGPAFSDPVFDPTSVTSTKVGTLTFSLMTVNTATLTYSVNGVVVTKQIQRQTLKNDTYGGTYVGQFKNVLTCNDATKNGTVIIPATLTVVHSGTSAFTMIATESSATCTYTGTYAQTGRSGNVNSGTYSCSDGTSGTFNSFEMYVNISGFTGRANINSVVCMATSHFGGMRQ